MVQESDTTEHLNTHRRIVLNVTFLGFPGGSLPKELACNVRDLGLRPRFGTWVRSLGWADPLEKEMAVHFRTIAWKIIGRTDAEAEAPTLWPPDAKIDSLDKILMVGKIEVGRKGDDRG